VMMVLCATFAIFKHHLFNVKVIATEIFTGSLWIFVLIRVILASSTEEKISNSILLVVTIIVGTFLVRSVIKEVATREKIEILANDLEGANSRLKELDQQKSEFVSLASHQLRGPLTAIKGYASLVLEGDFGDAPPPIKEAVEKIYKSSQAMVILVGDYLDVSRIEQGSMKYDYSIFNLKELIASIIGELKPTIEKAKLDISFDYNAQDTYVVNADQGKIKQVISNIIDNSTKYTPKGWIKVKIEKNKSTNKILISIKDSGVGIRPEVLPNLFAKFTRAPDASKTNIMGTGLGLYVAKKIMEAHKGRIWAESEGQDKGSTFFIELLSA
jgi:signal transduction histidine kinase